MPISKRRARKLPSKPRKARAPAVLPDRRAMESFLAAIAGRRGDEATAKAQDVMYEAWERTVVCVKFSKLVMVRVRGSFKSLEQHPFVRSEMTIPSSRPACWQSAARSGSQGCRRERGGTGGAGAQRP